MSQPEIHVLDAPRPSVMRGRTVRGRWGRNILTFLMVFGPGLIVMEADNDAALTYFIQEMVARLEIATGRGHAAMINAAALGTTAISLSSAWAYGEIKGWPHSLQRSLREAPGFYAVYVACVAAAAVLVLIPRAPLQLIILSVQVLAGIMLPSAIIFLQLLLNDKELLGERFADKRWNNVVNWTIIGALFALSLVLAAQVVVPKLFPKG